MITSFKNKLISSVISVVPTNEVNFMDEVGNYAFSESQHRKLGKVMGFNKRRVCKPGETISDYAVYGIQQLLDDHVITEDEIGAIIVVTTTPDHFIPPTSTIIHGHFNFSYDVACLDISQGCPGYIIGLINAFMTLDSMKDKKVLLVTGDMLSYRVSTRDRASRPIVGDAVSISVIENSEDNNQCYCSIKNNGKSAFAVYIPAGGLRMPITPETSVETADEFGNYRSKNHLVMNGDLVFNFIINEAPIMMEELINKANMDIKEIDYFLCHQSSHFTLKKLADRLGVSREIMPNDIVSIYGNSSCASIPVTFCHYFDKLYAEKKSLKIMFAGFGIGLTWGAVICDLPKPKYCKLVNYPHKIN